MWELSACASPKLQCWYRLHRQNYYRTPFSPTVPPSAARISRVVADGGTWRLKWERLNAGESNVKLPPRTCPGCSVPQPYRSHDWALVPAKPGLQGWILMNEWISLFEVIGTMAAYCVQSCYTFGSCIVQSSNLYSARSTHIIGLNIICSHSTDNFK